MASPRLLAGIGRARRRRGARAVQDAIAMMLEVSAGWRHRSAWPCAASAPSRSSRLCKFEMRSMPSGGPLPLEETSPAAPTATYLAPALSRARTRLLGERRFDSSACRCGRPCLYYGAGDPHNGYGPNRFRRLANRGETIVLFGEGEVRRDHVAVDDIAEIVRCVFLRASLGGRAQYRQPARWRASAP